MLQSAHLFINGHNYRAINDIEIHNGAIQEQHKHFITHIRITWQYYNNINYRDKTILNKLWNLKFTSNFNPRVGELLMHVYINFKNITYVIKHTGLHTF